MHFLSPDTAVFGRRGERDQEPQLHAHPQVAAAVIGSAVVGGAISSSASKSAANKQKDAANAATAQQGAMFDKTVDLNSPFRQAGVGATNKLSEMLGLSSPGLTRQQVFDEREADRLAQPGQTAYAGLNDADKAHWDAQIDSLYQQRLAAADPSQRGSDFGSLTKPFGMDDFQLDPGIKFQTEQGNLALTTSMAAKNGSLSGGALKALIGYNQGMAGLGYQSAFDRYMAGKSFTLGSLMDVSRTGQAAASGVTSAAPSFSSGIAGSIQGAGNASAAGTIGSGNAISAGVQGAGNGVFLNSLLNNQNSDLGGPITTSANPGGVYTAPSAINTA